MERTHCDIHADHYEPGCFNCDAALFATLNKYILEITLNAESVIEPFCNNYDIDVEHVIPMFELWMKTRIRP